MLLQSLAICEGVPQAFGVIDDTPNKNVWVLNFQLKLVAFAVR